LASVGFLFILMQIDSMQRFELAEKIASGAYPYRQQSNNFWGLLMTAMFCGIALAQILGYISGDNLLTMWAEKKVHPLRIWLLSIFPWILFSWLFTLAHARLGSLVALIYAWFGALVALVPDRLWSIFWGVAICLIALYLLFVLAKAYTKPHKEYQQPKKEGEEKKKALLARGKKMLVGGVTGVATQWLVDNSSDSSLFIFVYGLLVLPAVCWFTDRGTHHKKRVDKEDFNQWLEGKEQ
jgi:MFS family permease